MNTEALQSFFNDNRVRFSSETLRGYEIGLKQFFSFCKKNYDLVKPTDIRAWLAHMEEEGLKPNSIHLKLAAVKTFFHYCMEENRLTKNPAQTIHTPRKNDSLPYYLNKREVALLQELTKNDARERAIVDTLYNTGVRISELLNIKLGDVKWETLEIWIRKGKGNKERFVLFTHECAERLKFYLALRPQESEYLFANHHGKKLNRNFVQHQFRSYSKTLEFKVSPHTMRHTFAAHLAEKGMKQSYIQELLGHVNINSTRIYTRLMEHARKKQYDQYQI